MADAKECLFSEAAAAGRVIDDAANLEKLTSWNFRYLSLVGTFDCQLIYRVQATATSSVVGAGS